MAIPEIPVRFVIYRTQKGFDDLESKDDYTLYFIQETLKIYQGALNYNDVIPVLSLPTDPVLFKIYLVNNTEVYLRAVNKWIHLNEDATPAGGVSGGIGITLNDNVIGGVTTFIGLNDVLEIPENWQYRVKNSLYLEGNIINNGEIYIE